MTTYEAAVESALHGLEDQTIVSRDRRNRPHVFHLKTLRLDWTPTQVIARGHISYRRSDGRDDRAYFIILIARCDGSVVHLLGDLNHRSLASLVQLQPLIGHLVSSAASQYGAASLASLTKQIASRAEEVTLGDWQDAARTLIAVIAAVLSAAVPAGLIAPPKAPCKPSPRAASIEALASPEP